MDAAIACKTSHIGSCRPDLLALRFWVDGLGFEESARFEIDRAIAEVDPPVKLTSLFIQKDGLRVELLHYASPGLFGLPTTRRNQLGMTHFSFVVDDVDASASVLVGYGTIVAGTRSGQHDPDAVQIIFLADPDVTRVELMRLAKGQRW